VGVVSRWPVATCGRTDLVGGILSVIQFLKLFYLLVCGRFGGEGAVECAGFEMGDRKESDGAMGDGSCGVGGAEEVSQVPKSHHP